MRAYAENACEHDCVISCVVVAFSYTFCTYRRGRSFIRFRLVRRGSDENTNVLKIARNVPIRAFSTTL